MNIKTIGGKIVALIMTAVMLCSLFPAAVFADADDPVEAECAHDGETHETYTPVLDDDDAFLGQHDTKTVCDLCGTEISLTRDDCECEETVVEPTCSEGGYTLHTCVKCGGSYKDSYTDALGHEYGEDVTVIA